VAYLVQADTIKSVRDRRFRTSSRRWRRETRRAGKLTAKAARIGRHFLHCWSTAQVRAASAIIAVLPDIPSLTASPRGEASNWGAEVRTVSAINRHVLSQGAATAVAMLQYKAAEVGVSCTIEQQQNPPIAIGGELVAVAKILRRARRTLRKEAS
jgi:hypothetical protein